MRSHRRTRSPLLSRVLAAVVLAAYVLVITGSPIGHGWYLIFHLAQDHHDTQTDHTDLLGGDAPHAQAPASRHSHEPETSHESDQLNAGPHQAARDHLTAHHYDHIHTHGSEEDEHAAPSGGDGTKSADSPSAWTAPHEHDGQVHTHERKQDSSEALLVILVLDQHVLFAPHGTPLLPAARDADFVYVPATFLHPALPVETPPPRFSA